MIQAIQVCSRIFCLVFRFDFFVFVFFFFPFSVDVKNITKVNVSENTSLMDSVLLFLPVGPSQHRVRENTRSFRRSDCKVNCWSCRRVASLLREILKRHFYFSLYAKRKFSHSRRLTSASQLCSVQYLIKRK